MHFPCASIPGRSLMPGTASDTGTASDAGTALDTGTCFRCLGRPRPYRFEPGPDRCPGFLGQGRCCRNQIRSQGRNRSPASLSQGPLWDGCRKVLRRRCRPGRCFPDPVPHPYVWCFQEPLWVCLIRPAPLLRSLLFLRYSPGLSPLSLPSPRYSPALSPQALLFRAEVSLPVHSGRHRPGNHACVI